MTRDEEKQHAARELAHMAWSFAKAMERFKKDGYTSFSGVLDVSVHIAVHHSDLGRLAAAFNTAVQREYKLSPGVDSAQKPTVHVDIDERVTIPVDGCYWGAPINTEITISAGRGRRWAGDGLRQAFMDAITKDD